MSTTAKHEVYVPGHVPQKILMIVFGLVLLGFGLFDLGANFRLIVTGARAEARASEVVKTKVGLEDRIFVNDVELGKNLEAMDRSFLFWNVFSFTTGGGQTISVRLPSPGLLKPLYPLSDEDGLPTVLPVAYDRHDPGRVIFYSVFSTWVFPSLLTVIGFLASACGGILLRYAKEPIEVPILHNLDADDSPAKL